MALRGGSDVFRVHLVTFHEALLAVLDGFWSIRCVSASSGSFVRPIAGLSHLCSDRYWPFRARLVASHGLTVGCACSTLFDSTPALRSFAPVPKVGFVHRNYGSGFCPESLSVHSSSSLPQKAEVPGVADEAISCPGKRYLSFVWRRMGCGSMGRGRRGRLGKGGRGAWAAGGGWLRLGV